jgi:hypothetical protein
VDEVVDRGVVVDGRDDPAAFVSVARVLVQQGVRADQREQRAEVAAQPHGVPLDQSGERLAERDRDLVIARGQTKQIVLGDWPGYEDGAVLPTPAELEEVCAGACTTA